MHSECKHLTAIGSPHGVWILKNCPLACEVLCPTPACEWGGDHFLELTFWETP